MVEVLFIKNKLIVLKSHAIYFSGTLVIKIAEKLKTTRVNIGMFINCIEFLLYQYWIKYKSLITKYLRRDGAILETKYENLYLL